MKTWVQLRLPFSPSPLRIDGSLTFFFIFVRFGEKDVFLFLLDIGSPRFRATWSTFYYTFFVCVFQGSANLKSRIGCRLLWLVLFRALP